ncbi:hypothetical protein Tco_0858734 [Tanacetum coccineum]|uniref:Uncharacterized protein n=1 Tax=Tanacetum coccineum TaxID=301880 RepID=A0ABQ5BCY3_9ASTR
MFETEPMVKDGKLSKKEWTVTCQGSEATTSGVFGNQGQASGSSAIRSQADLVGSQAVRSKANRLGSEAIGIGTQNSVLGVEIGSMQSKEVQEVMVIHMLDHLSRHTPMQALTVNRQCVKVNLWYQDSFVFSEVLPLHLQTMSAEEELHLKSSSA